MMNASKEICEEVLAMQAQDSKEQPAACSAPTCQGESTLKKFDISAELYREYDFGGRTYKIEDPITLMFRPGGATHRVVDKNGMVHCAPAPGKDGCVLRWVNREGFEPVQF